MAASSVSLSFWAVIFLVVGFGVYLCAILLSILRLVLLHPGALRDAIEVLLWYSGVPTTAGILLLVIDLGFLLPKKRRTTRRLESGRPEWNGVTVALTAYNDEESIYDATVDFRSHAAVRRVIVVSNNSSDRTIERAQAADAIVFNETNPGYGRCVYRCLIEAMRFEDTNYVALCEGDMTFRAGDLDKFAAYVQHAEIVNGTRIVEQLRQYSTQLSTFMYYGNFFVGKLLEFKHLGRGTFTDVGTTYKVLSRETLERLLPLLDPSVNLEFNAHFMDTALSNGFSMVECPITFHPRIGRSKGGNTSNTRALKVGLRMILGLGFGWRGRANGR